MQEGFPWSGLNFRLWARKLEHSSDPAVNQLCVPGKPINFWNLKLLIPHKVSLVINTFYVKTFQEVWGPKKCRISETPTVTLQSALGHNPFVICLCHVYHHGGTCSLVPAPKIALKGSLVLIQCFQLLKTLLHTPFHLILIIPLWNRQSKNYSYSYFRDEGTEAQSPEVFPFFWLLPTPQLLSLLLLRFTRQFFRSSSILCAFQIRA